MGNSGGKEGRDGVGGESGVAQGDEVDLQVGDALAGTGMSEVVVKESVSLGGMIRTRLPEEDTVQGIQANAVGDVWGVLREKTTVQTLTLVARQKQIHQAIKKTALSSERANAYVYVACDRMKKHTKSFENIVPVKDEVQLACDRLLMSVEQTKHLVQLLPDDYKMEPMNFPRRDQRK
mmetsp:Transcript_15935/g.26027  ORF Transcript_15935/g.26027 Transcript_15935/m.26027 type:complete len:178 (-) Transcript_15935:4547-5080(-)